MDKTLGETTIDFLWTFVLPLICLFSFITNMINIRVFHLIKSHNSIYKYMLAKSVTDQVYLLCVSFIFIEKCGQFCDMKDTYLAKLYLRYVFYYGASSIALFSIILEMVIISVRYARLKGREFLKNANKKLVLSSLLLLCFLFHVPQFSMTEIRQTNRTVNSLIGKRVYVLEVIVKQQSYILRNFVLLQGLLRLALIFVVIILLSNLSRFLFKKYDSFISKEVITNESNL